MKGLNQACKLLTSFSVLLCNTHTHRGDVNVFVLEKHLNLVVYVLQIIASLQETCKAFYKLATSRLQVVLYKKIRVCNVYIFFVYIIFNFCYCTQSWKIIWNVSCNIINEIYKYLSFSVAVKYLNTIKTISHYSNTKFKFLCYLFLKRFKS